MTIFGDGKRRQVFTFTEDRKFLFKINKEKRSGEFYCMGNTAITSKFLAQKLLNHLNQRVDLKF